MSRSPGIAISPQARDRPTVLRCLWLGLRPADHRSRASASLLAQARARLPHARAHHADLCTLDLVARYDAVTCRGALDDLLDDRDGNAAIAALARHLNDTSLLLVDVRDADRARLRHAGGLTSQRTAALADGRLLFRATGTGKGGLLHVHNHRHREAGRACNPSQDRASLAGGPASAPWRVPARCRGDRADAASLRRRCAGGDTA